MASILTYARLVKFSHTIFAMPFAILSAFLAGADRPDFLCEARFWIELALVGLCMAAGRSAAMTFNRIADAKFDANNPRTAARPLTTGQLTRRQAWGFYALCCAVFAASAGAFGALYGNWWPLALAAPVLAYLSFYSLAKRFTALSHLVLGGALALAPLSAWVAISPGTFGAIPLALAAAVGLWTAGFDILYALQDIEADLRQKLHSIPAALGPANALWISRSLHLTAVTAMLWVFVLAGGKLGAVYLAGVGLAAAVLLVEQSLVSARDFSRVNAAFFLCNGLVSVILGVAGVIDVILHR